MVNKYDDDDDDDDDDDGDGDSVRLPTCKSINLFKFYFICLTAGYRVTG